MAELTKGKEVVRSSFRDDGTTLHEIDGEWAARTQIHWLDTLEIDPGDTIELKSPDGVVSRAFTVGLDLELRGGDTVHLADCKLLALIRETFPGYTPGKGVVSPGGDDALDDGDLFRHSPLPS